MIAIFSVPVSVGLFHLLDAKNEGGGVQEGENSTYFLSTLQKGLFSLPPHIISSPISFILLAYASKLHQESTPVQTWY